MASIVDRIYGLLLHPVASFQKIREEPFESALFDFVVLLVIFSLLSAVVGWILASSSLVDLMPASTSGLLLAGTLRL
ncbi:MAG TPA: hypothetical protein VE134_01920, partial [Methanomicrobiales archaeon]|nr:hypothetical protein [Methanomicrobiales archaeon]